MATESGLSDDYIAETRQRIQAIVAQLQALGDEMIAIQREITRRLEKQRLIVQRSTNASPTS